MLALLAVVLPWVAVAQKPREQQQSLLDVLVIRSQRLCEACGQRFVFFLGLVVVFELVKLFLRVHYGLWSRRERRAWALVFAVAVVVLPFFLGEYRLLQMSKLCAVFVVLLALNTLTGWAGQISLGHSAFVLIGAYGTGILMTGKLGVTLPALVAVAASALAAALVGLLLGVPALRLKGPYLALATMGVSISMPLIFKSQYVTPYSGGRYGLNVPKLEAPAFFKMASPLYTYFVVLLVAAAMFFLVRNVLKGRVGRAFQALRDSEEGAQAAGVDVARHKILAFVLSSLLAGVGGGLLAWVVGFVSADSHGLSDSINYLACTVIGGLGQHLGTLLGAVYLTFLPELTSGLSHVVPDGEYLLGAVNGTIVVLVMLFAPRGLASVLYKDGRWLLSASARDRYWSVVKHLEKIVRRHELPEVPADPSPPPHL